MLSDEWLSRYGLLENFNTSVTRTRTGTGTGTWTTGVTAIALCTSCSRANKIKHVLKLAHKADISSMTLSQPVNDNNMLLACLVNFSTTRASICF